MREDRRARHIADSPLWCGRLGCRKRPALAELKSEEAVRHPSRRRGGVRVAGLSHDKRQGSSRRARSTTAMFSEDDRCAIGMRSAGRAKRRTSPQIPRRSSALREWRDRNPATSGGRKTCPNREQSPPCPTSVGPPIVGGRAGRPLASDERDELPPSVPLGLGGRERCAEPAPVPSSDCPTRQISSTPGRANVAGLWTAAHATLDSVPSYFRPDSPAFHSNCRCQTATATPAKPGNARRTCQAIRITRTGA